MNLDMIIQILCLNREQQTPKPLKTAKVPTHPEEIHLPQPRLLLWIVHPIPHALQDTRKRRDSNACTDQDGDFVLEYIFGSTAKGAIEVYPWKNAAEG